MSIINPGDYPIVPTTDTGTTLAEKLNRQKLAEYSNHASPTRPADITAGGLWTRTGQPGDPTVMMFNGTADVAVIDSADTLKVSKAGDTMTGPLIIYQPDNIGLLLRSSSQAVGNNYIQFQNSGGANTGYIGHGSSANNAIQIVSDDGISLTTGGGHTFKRMDGTVNASVDTVGNFMALGTITPNGSDRRLKDSIAPITAPLDRLTQITGYDFTWKPESGMAGADTGFIAQEIQTVFPQMITGSAIGKTETEDPGYLGIALGNQITALLVEAVKELSAKLDSAMAEIAALKAAR